jgi:hypothetical protein
VSTQRLILVLAAAAATLFAVYLFVTPVSTYCGTILAPDGRYGSGPGCRGVFTNRWVFIAAVALIAGVLGLLAYRTRP